MLINFFIFYLTDHACTVTVLNPLHVLLKL